MASERESLVPRLRDVVITQLGIEIPQDDTDFFDSGLIDSLTLVEMLFEIEREFQVDIELDAFDFERARTLADLAAWIHALGARA